MPAPLEVSRQRALYDHAVADHGAALQRLARSYERNADRRADLEQDIHLAIWRSFRTFDGRCSLRTWVYRIAHNVAASHILLARRFSNDRLISLEADAGELVDRADTEAVVDHRLRLERLHTLIDRLRPPDRQLILLYLEGMDAHGIAEITGLSPANVATKIHRIKKVLSA
jgi:RNA polymerase sigma-70 factor, ECF subfamily